MQTVLPGKERPQRKQAPDADDEGHTLSARGSKTGRDAAVIRVDGDEAAGRKPTPPTPRSALSCAEASALGREEDGAGARAATAELAPPNGCAATNAFRAARSKEGDWTRWASRARSYAENVAYARST